MTANLFSYINKNPDAEIHDIFKYLYQSIFGCEHLVTDYSAALERLKAELTVAKCDDLPEIELIGEKYCRLHLKYTENGLSPETLCRLFLLSAEKAEQENKTEKLKNAISEFCALAEEESIGFSSDEIKKAASEWEKNGYFAVHHSKNYGKQHHPAYRVIKTEFLRLLPILCRIDTLLKASEKNITVAIDGRCASGKSTTAALLAQIYDCNILHTDDFFLRPEQRTAERYAEPGGNFDRERFVSEVLDPLSHGIKIGYRRFDCHEMKLCEKTEIAPKRLNIVEGCYSLHPELKEYYDLGVFSDISHITQKERIEKRNPDMKESFFTKWIPLEEKYFAFYSVRENADIVLR